MDASGIRGLIIDAKVKGSIAAKDAQRLFSSIGELLDATQSLSDEVQRALYEQEKNNK